MSRFERVVLACVFPVLAGCYSYAPLETARPGMEIRARLNTEAAVRRSQGYDEPILHYDGVVVESTSDSLAINVLVVRSSTTFQDFEIRDTVHLGTGEIQGLMGRKISVTKSLLFTVAAGAAAFAIVKGIDEVVGGTGDDPDGGGPQTLRVPIFRWAGARLLPALFGGGR
jgi:hypothetical protein